jgi:hypothetical protein
VAANRGSVAQRRWTSPLSVIIGGQAVLYSVIGASNLADLLGEAFGWSDAAWRSGNVSFVEYAIGKGTVTGRRVGQVGGDVEYTFTLRLTGLPA